MIVRVLVHLGNMARMQGDLNRSLVLLEEGLALARDGNLKMATALALGSLGSIAEQAGNDAWAADLYRERLTHYHELGIPWGTAESLECLASIAQRQRQLEQAASLFGVASMLREWSGAFWHDFRNSDPDEKLRAVRSVLSDAAFEAAWERGRAMTVEEAIEFASQAISSHCDEPESKPPAGLTPREAEVLGLIAERRSNREIAAELFISPRTVERHIENLYRKLDIHNRAEAIDFARRHLE